MPRRSPYRIVLSRAEAQELSRRAMKYTLPYYQVVRAKMILLAADVLAGLQKRVILVVTRGFDWASKSAGCGARSGWCGRDQNGGSVAVGAGPRSRCEMSSAGW